jgi:uncharacterized protein YqgV (UPF0045/DUF77 family)
MSRITAQISVYPLGETSLSPVINQALCTLREHGLAVEAGIMSSLVGGDDDVVFAALQSAFHQIAAQGLVVMVATFSNACPNTEEAKDTNTITYHAIGHVENAFDEPTAQDQIKAAESRIVLDPTLVEGLQGLEAGQRLMVVF